MFKLNLSCRPVYISLKDAYPSYGSHSNAPHIRTCSESGDKQRQHRKRGWEYFYIIIYLSDGECTSVWSYLPSIRYPIVCRGVPSCMHKTHLPTHWKSKPWKCKPCGTSDLRPYMTNIFFLTQPAILANIWFWLHVYRNIRSFESLVVFLYNVGCVVLYRKKIFSFQK